MKEKIDGVFGWAVVALAAFCWMGGSLEAQAVSIHEDFSVDGALDPNLQDADGAFTISGGSIHKTPPGVESDRHYIRTVATDYNTVDFVAEVTFTLSNTPRTTIHFFGLGPGDPDSTFFNEATGIYFRIHEPETASGRVDVAVKDFSSPFTPNTTVGSIPTSGLHRVRIRKTGNQLDFAVDIDYDGFAFVADISHQILNMSVAAPFLNATNSRIYFGTESPDHTFDDLQITLLSDQLDLDSRIYGTAPSVPLLTAQPLANGVNYLITVDGNWSAWTNDQLDPSPCPTQFKVKFPSPSVPGGIYAALDAEYLFSAPGPGETFNNPTRCSDLSNSTSGAIPFSRVQFSLNGGISFFDPTPVDSTFNPNHIYKYLVTGTGQKAGFRIGDNQGDDHGVLKIAIFPQSPTLTVTKVVVNDDGGTLGVADFPLFVDGGPVTSGAQNAFSAGPHTVSETSDSAYAAAIGGDCASDGSITLAPGESKSCTITNDDIPPPPPPPLLTVTKVVVNNDGGTLGVADFPLLVDGGPVTSGAQKVVSAGPHLVSETSAPGYAAAIGGDCASDGSVSLALGDVKNCTITNDDIAPVLTVTKVVVNNDGGTAGLADFPLLIDGNPVTSGVAETLLVGNHTVSETNALRYAATIGGDCASEGSVSLALGDVKTCTITNDDLADHYLSYDIKIKSAKAAKSKKSKSAKPAKSGKLSKSAKFEKFEVGLQDQFQSDLFTVKKRVALLTPVDKNGEGITDPVTHLVGYQVKQFRPEGEPKPDKMPIIDITITDQFFPEGLIVDIDDVNKADRLLVPASKSLTGPAPTLDPVNTNHYLCYPVKPPRGTEFPKGGQVLLLDQFNAPEGKLFDVGKPRRLCNPVSKEFPPGTVSEIQNPDSHLMCYSVKPAKGEPKHERTIIYLNDQFGPTREWETRKERELCLPAEKRL